MRGFPLFNLLAVGVALLALLVPLLRLNTPARAEATSPAAGSTPDAPRVPVTIGLRFVQVPLRVELEADGKPLEITGAGLERQAKAALPLRDKALEFDVKVVWPVEVSGSMAEISVAPDGLAEQRQNVWAEGAEASEVLRFEWKK